MGIMIEIRRHGDVLIKTSAGFKIPDAVKLVETKLIHQGANNAHVIEGANALVGEGEGGVKYMRIHLDAMVSHVGGSATHDSKPIPAGDYWVEIQTFYDHLSEEAKRVVD
ncbi:MAG: hypothetical protein HC883_00500 [Bdellovibrionaceae bacterium]|nr:hypothetical protein [Pseudobdellovibrionaceae bacterium]